MHRPPAAVSHDECLATGDFEAILYPCATTWRVATTNPAQGSGHWPQDGEGIDA